MKDHLTNLSKQWYRTLTSWHARKIYLVTGAPNWILNWIGRYVSTHLQTQRQLPVYLIDNPSGLRNQIIHYINRHTYLNGAGQRTHPSNHVFLTWFHGDPDDLNPAQQRQFTKLIEAAELVEKIVASCQITRQTLVKAGIPEAKLVTIPLGVDLDHFTRPTQAMRQAIRAGLGIPEGALCIGSFQKDGAGWEAGLEPKLIKGPDVFLEVVAKVSARYPNLLVLLTGPARGYVKQGLERLGIPYIHHFLDNYYDIVRYYHALDMYLITARNEGGPAALLESWATGVPLVSTRMGMPADLIKHRRNGLLAEVEDVAGLTEHIITLIEDAQLRQACRHQAWQDVQQYRWSLIAERYYDELYHPVFKKEGVS